MDFCSDMQRLATVREECGVLLTLVNLVPYQGSSKWPVRQ